MQLLPPLRGKVEGDPQSMRGPAAVYRQRRTVRARRRMYEQRMHEEDVARGAGRFDDRTCAARAELGLRQRGWAHLLSRA